MKLSGWIIAIVSIGWVLDYTATAIFGEAGGEWALTFLWLFLIIGTIWLLWSMSYG